MLSSPNAFLIIARVSVAHFPRYTKNLMLFHHRIHREIASGQTHDSKYEDIKISNLTHSREVLCAYSQDMRVPSSTFASRYYSCCTDGITNPGNNYDGNNGYFWRSEVQFQNFAL
jgi:hypothetical protein